VSVGSLVPLVLFGTTVLLAREPIRRPRGLAVASFLAAVGDRAGRAPGRA
jgi:hypothetical protein